MIRIELTDTTVDLLVQMFDKYAVLRGWEPIGDNEYKIRYAIDFGISALYLEMVKLENQEEKKKEARGEVKA